MLNKVKKIDLYNLFISIKFFIRLLLKKQKYDVVFLTHRHFNRGRNGENLFLKPFILFCKKNNLSYIVFEENSLDGKFNMFPRNKDNTPFDFITLLQRILRKLYTKTDSNFSEYKNFYLNEKKVSKLINLFLKNLSSTKFITLAHNNIELLRYSFPEADIYDYQHGIIWDGHENVLENSKASEIKTLNNLKTILYGKSFKELMIKFDYLNYYNEKNLIDIGYYLSLEPFQPRKNNKTILYSIQNVDLDDYSDYYTSIINLLSNSRFFFISNNYEILIKNHPRYDRNQPLKLAENLSFVKILDDNKTLTSLYPKVSLHITSKSTTAFDMALNSIPTIFTNLYTKRSPILMFDEQYNFPFKEFIINNESELIDILKFLEDSDNYETKSKEIYNWATNFYQKFDEEKLSLILQDKK